MQTVFLKQRGEHTSPWVEAILDADTDWKDALDIPIREHRSGKVLSERSSEDGHYLAIRWRGRGITFYRVEPSQSATNLSLTPLLAGVGA